MVTAHGARIDLQFATARPPDAGPPRQHVRDRPLPVDPDQLRRPFRGRSLHCAGAGARRNRSQSLDAGLNSSEHIRIVAFAAFQPADEELTLLERTAGSLQRRPQLAVLLVELRASRALGGKFLGQAFGVRLNRVDRTPRFL